VPLAVVGALAVHHHRRGEHEAGYAASAHRLEQHRGAGHVDVRVERQVGQGHAKPDHGGQVTDRVHPVERVVHRRPVPDVGDQKFAFVADVGGFSRVHGGRQRIEAAYLMTGGNHGLEHVGPDKTGRSCY
jgi:hypothetical protein